MIIHKPEQVTKLPIWAPRYSDAYTATEERVALLAQYKVQQASPVFIVEFTKAKHLEGQRFAITREKAMSYPIDSNGSIACYAVPMSAFEHWDSAAEVGKIAANIFDH